MKANLHGLLVLAALVSCSSAFANEPIKCYEMAWGSREKQGLGLTAGQAVTLCSGTTDAAKTIECFVRAWAHRDDGGLGLTAGQAITLCKSNSLP
jgi:hypothetical protein